MSKFKGLTDVEVVQSRKTHGSNELYVRKPTPFWKLFLESFKDTWIIILCVALLLKLILSFVALIYPDFTTPAWFEVISLLAAIIASTGFTSVANYNGEKSFSNLSNEAAKIPVKVYRNGILIETSIDDLVVGDEVLLQSGDLVPFDGEIIDGDCHIDFSSLNGESEEVYRSTKLLDPNDEFPSNKLFRGTNLTSGEVILKATTVGDHTMMGTMNTAIQEDTVESPSKEKMEKLAQYIGYLGYSAAIIYIAIVLGQLLFHNAFASLSNLQIFLHILSIVMFAITIIIMAVPEGLPMMMSMVASMNMRKLLENNVLVKRQTGIETSGYMTVLYSDKTGTITQGVLSVVDIILGDGTLVSTQEFSKNTPKVVKERIFKGIAYNNDSQVVDGEAIGSNATDRALLNYLIKEKEYGVDKDYISQKEQFNSAKKYASVKLKNGITYYKGAPEQLLKTVTKYLDKHGNIQKFTKEINSTLTNVMDNQAKRSMRLLAIVEEIEGEKILLACTSIRDNVRTDIRKTVETLNSAGIRVVMVTGDRKETAMAIATESGIIQSEDDIILTHDELDSLSDDELKEILPKIRVVARALPLDKKRLVSVSQELGEVVGMTGDGVNDSVALKSADVGFAMGDGTRTAQETSDIVILNNSLSSISQAIKYGRTMTHSVKKFIIFQLTVNVSTILMSTISPLFGIEEPFTIIQILWINLIMDTLAALAFGEEPPLDKYMKEKPIARSENILSRYMMSAIGWSSIFITVISLIILNNGFNIHSLLGLNSELEISTFMFTFFIYSIIFNSLNTRSNGFNLFEHISENKKFIYVMGSIAIAQSLIIQFGGQIFNTTTLSLRQYVMALVFSFFIIIFDFIRKAILRK